MHESVVAFTTLSQRLHLQSFERITLIKALMVSVNHPVRAHREFPHRIIGREHHRDSGTIITRITNSVMVSVNHPVRAYREFPHRIISSEHHRDAGTYCIRFTMVFAIYDTMREFPMRTRITMVFATYDTMREFPLRTLTETITLFEMRVLIVPASRWCSLPMIRCGNSLCARTG